MKTFKKILYFFFPFLSKDWQGFGAEIQKGRIMAGLYAQDRQKKLTDKAFKAGQNLRKKVDPQHKMKIGSNKK